MCRDPEDVRTKKSLRSHIPGRQTLTTDQALSSKTSLSGAVIREMHMWRGWPREP